MTQTEELMKTFLKDHIFEISKSIPLTGQDLMLEAIKYLGNIETGTTLGIATPGDIPENKIKEILEDFLYHIFREYNL